MTEAPLRSGHCRCGATRDRSSTVWAAHPARQFIAGLTDGCPSGTVSSASGCVGFSRHPSISPGFQSGVAPTGRRRGRDTFHNDCQSGAASGMSFPDWIGNPPPSTLDPRPTSPLPMGRSPRMGGRARASHRPRAARQGAVMASAVVGVAGQPGITPQEGTPAGPPSGITVARHPKVEQMFLSREVEREQPAAPLHDNGDSYSSAPASAAGEVAPCGAASARSACPASSAIAPPNSATTASPARNPPKSSDTNPMTGGPTKNPE
jgi:hypothetical protein